MESLTSQFERQVAVFLQHSRLNAIGIRGAGGVGCRKFLGDVCRGRSPRLATADRVLAFMEAYSRADGLDGSRDSTISEGGTR